MNQFDKVKQLVSEAEEDAKKFYDNGNKAAGVRLRASLQKIKVAAQDARAEVSELKSDRTSE